VTAGRLKAARRRRAWSREELAVRSGLSWSAIAQIESGRRTNVRPATVAALAGALGVTADYLLRPEPRAGALLEHHLLVYAGEDEFVAGAGAYLLAGLTLDEPTLVVTSKRAAEALRSHLGPDADKATFADADSWYSSPGDAFSAYRQFATDAVRDGAAWARVLGEPVWSGRTDMEVESWVRYESLLNLCLANLPLTVLCAYDAGALDSRILSHARMTHPRAREGDAVQPIADYADPGDFLLA
jgi:transcriptional regulator with XRE-family HTH domain